MKIVIATLHVSRSSQAVALAAGNLKAALPASLRSQTILADLYPGQSPEDICNSLLLFEPNVIAFSLYVWNRSTILATARLIRQRHPHIVIIAGGPEASADAVNVIDQGTLDGVILGEGEEPFRELMIRLEGNSQLSSVAGFMGAASADAEYGVPQAACSEDPATLESPWINGDLPLEEGCGVLWEVARGCRFNCAFCFDAKGQSGVRPLPFERLREELQLFRKKRVGQIWILDSTFNAPPERGHQLLQLLLEEAPDIHYHIEAKADFLDRRTAQLLSQLSCSVQIGLQSAKPEVLHPLRRSLDLRKMERNLDLLSQAGVTFGLDLIYGLPGDNHRGFRKSLDFALKQQPNQVDIFPLAVLPGTELYDNQEAFGITGDTAPPYCLLSSTSYSQRDFEKSRLLAAATDIFYNRGRAVGFFLQICEALSLAPADFLEEFADWLIKVRGLKFAKICSAEAWWPQVILPLQVQFTQQQFKRNSLNHCQDLAEDLIHYHYLCAEMVLTEECRPHPAKNRNKNGCSWKCNPAVRIHRFNHRLTEIETYGGEALATIAGYLSPEKEYAIFLRQNGEFIVEALDDGFAKFLLAANGQDNLQQLEEKGHRLLAEEFNFAIDQGLLIPAG